MNLLLFVLSLTIKTITLAGMKVIPITNINPARKPPTTPLADNSYLVNNLKY
jgi:hypothetical protein